VTATFENVRHLYRTIDRLNLDLRNALQMPPTPLRAIGGTSLGKMKDRDDERQIIRSWYGRVHVPGVSQDNEPEEEGPADEEPDEEGVPQRKRRSPPVDIRMNDRLLAIKLVLFESGNARFEPVIRYAVIGDWVVSGKHMAERRGKSFAIPRNMLRRLLRPLPSSGAGIERIATNAKVRRPKGVKTGKASNQLSYRCFGGIKETPLFHLDSPQRLVALVQAIKRHWTRFGRRAR
jgi:hypothetical protein